jgi:hypothetical protein
MYFESVREPDRALRELHVAHFRFGLQDRIGHLLLGLSNPVGLRHPRSGYALICRHGERKQNSGKPGQAELIPDAVDSAHTNTQPSPGGNAAIGRTVKLAVRLYFRSPT